jgi:hypothetical protein
MSFIRQLIQRKLSTVTGGTVMMGEFKFAPMSGTIEAFGLKIAAERFVPPYLAIERVEAQVIVSRALRGEIVLKSLVIDRPTFIYQIHADGKTNQPTKPTRPLEAIVPKAKTAGGTWDFSADKIAINHGRFEYRDATHDNYKLTVEGINATITPDQQDVAISLTADSVARRDKEIDVGTLKLLGKLSGGGIRQPLASSLSSRASIADSVIVDITSTMLANRCFNIELAGALPLATVVGLLPMGRAQTWTIAGPGTVGIRSSIAVELFKSVNVSHLELKLGELEISRTFGNFTQQKPRKPQPLIEAAGVS